MENGTIMEKEELREFIENWFAHIEQLATDKKTLNGDVMDDKHCLDEIKCLAKNARDFIERHW